MEIIYGFTWHFLVTGAASGIGAAIALETAKPKSQLVLHTLSNTAGLEDITAQCQHKST